MRCPSCNSLKTKKNGTKILVSGNRTQEFRCIDCNRYFSIQINVNVLHELKYVEPGDIIEIPELYTSILFGNTGFIQALTSIATLILAYQATI